LKGTTGNVYLISNITGSFGYFVIRHGGGRSRRLCYPPKLGAIKKLDLARFRALAGSGYCGWHPELFCGSLTFSPPEGLNSDGASPPTDRCS